MLAVINQPNYIPWRGYFDLIDEADLFIFHDDIQYTKQDWRNRNRIKSKQGLLWLSVPVQKPQSHTLINEVVIDYAQDWQLSHKRQIAEAYRSAAYFKTYADPFFDLVDRRYEKLADLTIDTTLFLMKALGIETPTRRTSELGVNGQKTDRLIEILRATHADAYLSGPAAKSYIDEARFRNERIGLLWKNYDYKPYPQLWGSFEPQVTVLDLLFNCGPDARACMKSLTPSNRA